MKRQGAQTNSNRSMKWDETDTTKWDHDDGLYDTGAIINDWLLISHKMKNRHNTNKEYHMIRAKPHPNTRSIREVRDEAKRNGDKEKNKGMIIQMKNKNEARKNNTGVMTRLSRCSLFSVFRGVSCWGRGKKHQLGKMVVGRDHIGSCYEPNGYNLVHPRWHPRSFSRPSSPCRV